MAILYATGIKPREVDHINHIRDDDRLRNLRSVTHQENHRNRAVNKNNKSGVVGVHQQKEGGKWRAQIMIDGKQIMLGRFHKKEDAIKARKEAEKKYGFHKNHGRVFNGA